MASFEPPLIYSNAWRPSNIGTANADNAAAHMPYVEPPPGFAQAVGKPHRADQRSHSPDDVLASNFGRKLNIDNGSQGTRMQASQSAQRLESSGDTSTSGRPSVDSESSSLAPGRQQQSLHPGMVASGSTNSLHNLQMASQAQQPDQSRRQQDEDIFSIVGGCELGADSRHHPLQQARNNVSSNSLGSAAGLPNSSSVGNLSCLGDLPEEQPSRILFIRGLDATVSDEALVQMFEAYGEIRSLYTACKPRGFVVLSFYDLRASCLAVHALQGAAVGSAALHISFSTPKDNMGDKDAHQGTVTIYNVSATATPFQLAEQFAMYGDVKDVREDPQVQGCWLVEYFDIRHAAAAVKALSRSSSSHARLPVVSETDASQAPQQSLRNVQSSHVLNDEYGSSNQLADDSWQGSRSWDNKTGAAFQEHLQTLLQQQQNGMNGQLQQQDYSRGLNSSQLGSDNLSSYLQHQGLIQPPTYTPQPPTYNPQMQSTNSLEALLRNTALVQQLQNNGLTQNGSSNSLSGQYAEPQLRASASSGNLSMGGNSPPQLPSAHGSRQFLNQAHVGGGLGGVDGQYGLGRRTAGGMSMSTGDLAALYEAAQLTGSQADLVAAASSGNLQALNSMSTGNLAGLGGGASMSQSQSASNLLNRYQGSDTNLYQRNLEAQALMAQQQALGMGIHSLSSQTALDLLQGLQGGAYSQNATQTAQFLQQQQQLAALGPTQQAALLRKLQSTGSLGLGTIGKILGGRGVKRGDDISSGGRLSRRNADPIAEAERKAQQEKLYSLDLDRVLAGEDKRTTLMIKNIPNKYTQKMLLTTIDEKFRGTYDFFYLPIDFKNKCNVGYAFINMVRPAYIIPLIQKFDRKKWEKFNSEKVCNISYARIQGKISLVTHFQNSSLLHEDKRCRPILFNSNGEVAGEQEPFPVGPNMRVRSSKTGPHQGQRPEMHLNAPEMWQNTERGKELMSRGMRVDLNQ